MKRIFSFILAGIAVIGMAISCDEPKLPVDGDGEGWKPEGPGMENHPALPTFEDFPLMCSSLYAEENEADVTIEVKAIYDDNFVFELRPGALVQSYRLDVYPLARLYNYLLDDGMAGSDAVDIAAKIRTYLLDGTGSGNDIANLQVLNAVTLHAVALDGPILTAFHNDGDRDVLILGRIGIIHGDDLAGEGSLVGQLSALFQSISILYDLLLICRRHGIQRAAGVKLDLTLEVLDHAENADDVTNLQLLNAGALQTVALDGLLLIAFHSDGEGNVLVLGRILLVQGDDLAGQNGIIGQNIILLQGISLGDDLGRIGLDRTVTLGADTGNIVVTGGSNGLGEGIAALGAGAGFQTVLGAGNSIDHFDHVIMLTDVSAAGVLVQLQFKDITGGVGGGVGTKSGGAGLHKDTTVLAGSGLDLEAVCAGGHRPGVGLSLHLEVGAGVIGQILATHTDGDTALHSLDGPDRQAAGQGVAAGSNGNAVEFFVALKNRVHGEAIGNKNELTAGSDIRQTADLHIGIGGHCDAGQQAQTQNQSQHNCQKTLCRIFHK